ncbi:PREDICTED: ubiquitin-like protein 4B [Gekko japonicus]|uniref:Ubiquitin-like protein 4B n=1 Tax=Gekko japonicus TaxID=146911 RepID=A0ABM1JKQ5_GEKJA|nr:PREDICTED: ubiquitin-like protein 4B [Gekko japonicus]
MLLTVKRLLGQQCRLQVSGEERISLVKSLVSEQLNVPVNQQTLLFRGKVLEGEHRLSDYPIGPESILYLVIKKPERVYLEELSKPAPVQRSVWYQLSQVLEKHFRTSDAVRVLERVLNDYYRDLGLLSLEDIEELAGCILNLEEEPATPDELPDQEGQLKPPVSETMKEHATHTEP